MIIKIAEYKVKKEELQTVLPAIRDFVISVRDQEPDTHYEAYRRGDTLEFIHLMKFPDEQAEKKHASADYTEAFTSILYPRCEIKPAFTDLADFKTET